MKSGLRKLTIFTILTLLLLTACSSNSSSGKDGNNKNGQNEITLMVLSEWEDTMGKIIAKFEEQNPNIKVKLETHSFDGLFEAIEVKLGSESDDYDVIAVDGPVIANYTVKGYLEPLDTYLEDGISEKWIPSSVEASTYDGKLMAAPMNTSSQVLFYNKDLFEKYGVEPPAYDTDKRWTWDQTVDAANKLTIDENGDGVTDVFGFTFEQVSRAYQILPLVQGYGVKVLGESGLDVKGNFNSPEMVQAGEFYYNLFNKWKVSPKVDPLTSVEYFKSGDVAMFVGGTWNTVNFEGVNYGIAPHPYFEGEEAVTPTGSWHFGIPKFSNKKEEAAKLIEYLTVGEGADIWYELEGNLPSKKELLNEIETSEEYNEFPKTALKLGAYEAQNTAVTRPVSPGYSEFQSVWLEVFENIKNGQKAEESINNGAAKLESLIKKYESLK
ncbi:ABC transporter substrate-binding protein [Bacillus timonensis]|uniref:ABC transporter substrate-binding protein n=1 Tax=Bacillus timonensis TaxID=1033734 RepID=UPI000287EA0B|nr:sugar ABC transporter substrate-binding protein [Bacillus timonensis]